MNKCPRCNGSASLTLPAFPFCDACYWSLNSAARWRLVATTELPPSNLTGSAVRAYGGAWLSEQKKPPAVEERSEPFYGWRSYTLGEGGVLYGARTKWTGRKLTATCTVDLSSVWHWWDDDVTDRSSQERRPRSSAAQKCVSHLETGRCICGIYVRAKPEYDRKGVFIFARVLAHGVVATDEDGNARASEAQIEALYVVKRPEWPSSLYEYVDWDRIGNALRGRYGVAVQMVESCEQIISCAKAAPV